MLLSAKKVSASLGEGEELGTDFRGKGGRELMGTVAGEERKEMGRECKEEKGVG